MAKFFKESKKSIFGPFGDVFDQIWTQMNFPGKQGLCQLLNIELT